MRFTFTVEVEVERVEGKFASRDEIADVIAEALGEANPENIDGIGTDGGGEYEVTLWEVDEAPQEKKGKKS